MTSVDIYSGVVRDDKRGAIPHQLPPILERLNLDAETFLGRMQGTQRRLSEPATVGGTERLKSLAMQLGQKYFRGQRLICRLYVPGARSL